MPLRIIVAVLAGLCLAAPSSAQTTRFTDSTRWVPLGGVDRELAGDEPLPAFQQYVDVTSVRVTPEKTAHVAVGWAYRRDQTTSVGSPCDANVGTWEVDCDRRRMRLVSLATHYRDETLFTDTEGSDWMIPTRTAVTFPIIRVVCDFLQGARGT